jgi:LytR cell envelope-related transcriptional attenuator
VDHPLPPHDALVRPWRLATLVAATIAALELLLLVVVGGALIAKNAADPARKPPAEAEQRTAAAGSTRARARAKPKPKPAVPVRKHVVAKPDLTRTRVAVLVLNGNGRQGAAAAAATHARVRGYRIRAVANAPRMDYPRSLVMFRRGFEGEGVRLARDLGIRSVGPLDGIRAGQLQGAHAVIVVGA